jgi:bla regulator protein blaR1
MIFASEFLPRWTEVLGWTLLHSVWQGALAAIIVIFSLRLLPLRFSKSRYAVACAGLALLLICNAITFAVLQSETSIDASQYSYLIKNFSAPNVANATVVTPWYIDAINWITEGINDNMWLILMVWCLGALAFSIRLAGGWWFISRLKSDAVILEGEWHEKLQSLASDLKINKIVTLAESTRITTPMVLGFMKPLVLVPVGMLSGLTSSEVETIFLHELAHIRRHDYVVNLAQAFIETVLFFNPFVWIISNIVRREREYCCDDEVITFHGSSTTYANALAQLEHWKLTNSTFALALAANKNQLLNRIKRIMEKTGQKYSLKDRFIPAVLLIVGLVCASWLTVQNKRESAAGPNNNTFASDTTPRKFRSRTTIIRIDENGDTHEQVFEEHDGDEAFIWTPPTPWSDDFESPVISAIPPVPAMPAFPSFHAFPSFPAFPSTDVWIHSTDSDTIPGAWMKHGADWEKFSEEFEKKFSEEFSEFYKTHEKDFDNMMKEMELQFKKEFEEGDFHGQLAPVQRLHELARLEALTNDEHMRLSEHQMAAAEALVELSELQAPMLASVDLMSADLAQLDGNLKIMEEKVERFDTELKEMLIEDGYLKKDEKLTNISWSDDKIEVNGKKIKEADAKRYREKHDKLLSRHFHVNRIE